MSKNDSISIEEIRKMQAELARLNAEVEELKASSSKDDILPNLENTNTDNIPEVDDTDQSSESEYEPEKSSQRGPLTMKEFKRKYANKTEPLFLLNGKQVCAECEKPDKVICAKNMCSRCYRIKLYEMKRDNPAYYKKCKRCKEPSAFHRSITAAMCLKCYTRHNRKTTRCNSIARISRNSFKRQFIVSHSAPFILPNGKKACADCHDPKAPISAKNRCSKCYAKWNYRIKKANPKSYRKCRRCQEVKFHQGRTSRYCSYCCQMIRASTNNEKQKKTNRMVQNSANRRVVASKSNRKDKVIPMNRKRTSRARQLLRRAVLRSWINGPRIKRDLVGSNSRIINDHRTESPVKTLNVTAGERPNKYFPIGWKAGYCKLCMVKLKPDNMPNYSGCINYCRRCYEERINQRICSGCGLTKRHYGKGKCMECFKMPNKKASSRVSTAKRSSSIISTNKNKPTSVSEETADSTPNRQQENDQTAGPKSSPVQMQTTNTSRRISCSSCQQPRVLFKNGTCFDCYLYRKEEKTVSGLIIPKDEIGIITID